MKKLFYYIVLIFIAILMGVAFKYLSNMQIEHDNHSMQSILSNNDNTYELFKQKFNAEYELMVVVSKTNFFTEAGENQLNDDMAWVRGLAGIKDVFVPDFSMTSSGFISVSNNTVGILVVLEAGQSRKDRIDLLHNLRDNAGKHIVGNVNVIGLPLLRESIAMRIAHDQQIVTPMAVVMMIILLSILFRRPAGVLFPMSVAGLSLLITLGTYSALGYTLNSITSLLPPVVIVLSVMVGVHLIDAWNHALEEGLRGTDAIYSAMRDVWKPCIFTSGMTVVGFLSLCFSPIPAVKIFAVFAAYGVSLSVVFALILFPIVMLWVRKEESFGRLRFMGGLINVASRWPVKYPVIIFMVAIVITLVSVWFAKDIKNNTDLIGFFKHSDPVYIAHSNVDESLGSVRTIDLLVMRGDHELFDLQGEDELLLTNFVSNISCIDGVVWVDSIFDILSEVTPDMMIMGGLPDIADRFVSDDGKVLRMQIHLGNMGTAGAAIICDKINAIANDLFINNWQAKLTGSYYLLIRDSNQLVSTLIKSFSISLLIILLSTCLLFRTIKVLIPAFIANVLPIIWGVGLMGILHIDLSTGSAMVAAVVIGLAIDDTIHYLYHLQQYHELNFYEATEKTTLRIGHALIVSTVVLVCGFWMGTLGSFRPTNTFAMLTGAMMISALFCDLFVLPAYLNIVGKVSDKLLK